MSHKNMLHAQETPNGEIIVDNFAGGCDACPAREYCEHQPDGTCCRENFMGWSKEVRNGP